ncbi:MAG: hypothetical protein ACPHO6_17925, partial [Candidatus Latescibacterota bacterium]
TDDEEKSMRRVGPMIFTQTDMGGNVLYDDRAVEELIDSAFTQDDSKVRALLTECVPGYMPIQSGAFL